MAEEVQSISGKKVWEGFGDRIPGSTRVPVEELKDLLGNTQGKVGLDLGCGSGRSTEILTERLGCKVVALDLSLPSLKAVKTTEEKVQASGEFLPFEDKSFDFVNVCGVMTNLTDWDPEKAILKRANLAKEVFRCLKNYGVIVVSDFCADQALSKYPVSYRRHALITKEMGTIAVFDPKAKVSFEGLSDEEVEALRKSEDLVRFAHHYKPAELDDIFKEAGFQSVKYTVEVGKTPSGIPIDNVIFTARRT